MANTIAARELLLRMLGKGVTGDAGLLYRWLQMYFALREQPLSANFLEFKDDFSLDVQELFRGLPAGTKLPVNEQEIEIILRKLHEDNIIELVAPYDEYRLKDFKARCQNIPLTEGFFACNNLDFNPLQYIRSRVTRFCECHRIAPEHKEEIVIAVTEAAENAVKYSDQYAIYVWQRLDNDIYHIKVYNGVPELDLNSEISRGKFSEDVSLMRGVLVMSKLLDHLDIIRDSEKRRVEFVGSKKIAITNR